MKWRLRPNEFASVWADTKLESYPYPLWISRKSATATSNSDEPQSDEPADVPDVAEALRVLSMPDLRITVMGDRGDRHGAVRMLGGTVGDVAALAVQRPAGQNRPEGTLDIWLGSRDELGEHVAAAFPKARVGRRPGRSAPTDRVRDTELDLNDAVSDPTAIRQLLAATRDAEGYLRVEPAMAGPDPERSDYLHWIDVTDDGRYLIHADSRIRVTPASATVIGEELQHAIERTLPTANR